MQEGDRRSIVLTAIAWGALFVFVAGAFLAVLGNIVTDSFEISIGGMTFKGGNVGIALCALGAFVISRVIPRAKSVELFSITDRPRMWWLGGRGSGLWLAIALVCVALLIVILII